MPYKTLKQRYLPFEIGNSIQTLSSESEHKNILLRKTVDESDALIEDAYTVQGISNKCLQRYPKESTSDYNTFEMYKGKSASQYHRNDGGGSETRHIDKQNSVLKVFLLPMTHVDPGWLETFETYAEDTNRILNNMLLFLKTHPRMRFMWCEMIFFEKWWSTLNETGKNDVKGFISSGQLEMSSGSWVMTDEANPFFAVTIDNIVEGQQFIFNELGATAKTIWSNDPFGYSPTVPYLFTKTGIKRAIINRIHHPTKNHLQSHHAVPFKWRQYFDAEGVSDVLTHVLPYTHYDILNSCGPSQSICCEFDFKRLTHFSCPSLKPVPITPENVVERAELLEQQFRKLSEMYESNVLLVMWGDDFRYNDISEWYQQYDNLVPLFDQINSLNRTQVQFGTFVDYFTALEEFYSQPSAPQPSTLSGDFFPYECALGDTWSGYYTTRPFYKRQGRLLHALIRSADLIGTNAMKFLSETERKSMSDEMIIARRNLLLFQHHDAITGTSKKHVMSDYGQLLFDSMRNSANSIEKATNALHKNTFQINDLPLQYNESLSKRIIRIEPGNRISVAVFNSIEQQRIETIELLVSTHMVNVIHNDRLLRAQIEPYVDPVTGDLSEHLSLVFQVELPPLTTTLFTLVASQRNIATHIAEILFVASDDQFGTIHSNQFSKKVFLFFKYKYISLNL